MALEIIGHPRSNFVRAVRMVAHEKGVDYEHQVAMPHSDEVKALHPLGLIPAMRHDGLALFESQAIARYIDSQFDGPPLIPSEPKAAAPINQWIAAIASNVDQLILRQYVVVYAFQKDEDGNVPQDKIDSAVKRFPRMYAMLDSGVGDGYLGGDSFTMADCFLMPILFSAQNFPEGKSFLEQSPALKAYYDRIAQRPSFIETAA